MKTVLALLILSSVAWASDSALVTDPIVESALLSYSPTVRPLLATIPVAFISDPIGEHGAWGGTYGERINGTYIRITARLADHPDEAWRTLLHEYAHVIFGRWYGHDRDGALRAAVVASNSWVDDSRYGRYFAWLTENFWRLDADRGHFFVYLILENGCDDFPPPLRTYLRDLC